MIREEKDAANKNLWRQWSKRLWLTWHHFRISLGPFMLDPWEQFLFIGGILLLIFAIFHATERVVTLAAPSLKTLSTTALQLAKPLLESVGLNGV